MRPVFLYGTLRHVPLLRAVLGRVAPALREARLSDHEVRWAKGESYPLIRQARGGVAEGLLLEDLSDEERERLTFYEGAFGYRLRPVRVETGTGEVEAEAWFPDTLPEAGGRFELAEWEARWAKIAVLAAEEAMGQFGRVPPERLGAMLPQMRARAASALRAAVPAPAEVRRGDGAGAVRLLDRRRPYTGYFSVEEDDLQHPRFGGGESRAVTRAAFVMADAVTVLPYDPARDRVLLVEQFRMGPYVRGDARVFSLEPIAGRVDPGEAPEETARREATEEAGLALGQLELAGAYYPSPGAVTEFLYSYVAPVALPDGTEGLHGADSEDEDIRTHLVGFDRLMRLIETGEAGNGPLILSAYWLARNRERLRASG